MNVPESFWKYVAIGAISALLGSGGTTFFNGEATAALARAEQVQEEMDDRSDYQARVHMNIQEDVEDLEKVNVETRDRLTRMEVLLERAMADLTSHHQ